MLSEIFNYHHFVVESTLSDCCFCQCGLEWFISLARNDLFLHLKVCSHLCLCLNFASFCFPLVKNVSFAEVCPNFPLLPTWWNGFQILLAGVELFFFHGIGEVKHGYVGQLVFESCANLAEICKWRSMNIFNLVSKIEKNCVRVLYILKILPLLGW